ALGLADRATRLDSREDLFTLALADLRVPPPLADGRIVCRRALPDDAPTIARYGAAYVVEALGEAPAPVTDEAIARERAQIAASNNQFVLIVDGALVAMMRFTAELPDAVQIGGVFTPSSLRGRGYARAVVAGALVDARARGVTRSVLFTGEDNVPARTAYLALGYRIVGDYALVHFA
ncbi:MAG TPA: GNAT family N-acetyltransferase, partial [Polyangia bacterium]